MGIKRIYYPLDLLDTLTLSEEYYNYIKNVLRLRPYDKICLINNKYSGTYRISQIVKSKVLLLREELRHLKGANYSLILYQSILKREYMDNVVEKSAELGVTKFIPVYTERSIPSIKNNTIDRFKDLIIKGAIQAELEFIPEIEKPVDIYEIKTETTQNFLFYERHKKKSIPEINTKSISIFIGPEGGLADKEVKFLEKNNFQVISPIDTILKAETAAIVFIGFTKILMDLQ
jgi:16S rRNA (uracil1498-N3)-methyltransferase